MRAQKNIGRDKGITEKLSHFLSPSGVDLEDRSRRILSGLVVIITAPVLYLFSIIHLFRDDILLGSVLLASGLCLTGSFLVLRKLKTVTYVQRLNIAFVGFVFLYQLKIAYEDHTL